MDFEKYVIYNMDTKVCKVRNQGYNTATYILSYAKQATFPYKIGLIQQKSNIDCYYI